jgi:CRISPR system Cascade subunit CasD
MKLELRLSGLMQAWGVEGSRQIRRTNNQPTKQAVLGMIRAAKGLARDETWAELEGLAFSCRTEKAGRRMWDFATMRNVISADGSIVHPQGNQEKEYLVDADFVVTLEGDDGLVLKVQAALEHPVFLLGLGRRDCMPTMPILMERLIQLPCNESYLQSHHLGHGATSRTSRDSASTAAYKTPCCSGS